MKTALLLSTLLFLTACSDVSFTYNGLKCPTNDVNQINDDFQTCHVYNIHDVDKAFRNDPECQKCLKEKGYQLSLEEPQDNNASH